MKKLKKALCLCLALLMTVPIMASCKKKDGGPSEETTAPTADVQGGAATADADGTASETGWATDEDGFVLDRLENVNLEGRTVNILTGSGRMEECWTEGNDIGTQIKSAVFMRNQAVQARLNCTLNYVAEDDGYYNSSTYTSKAMALSSTQEVDLFSVYSLTASSLMLNGVLADLTVNEILDFEKPWWNDKMINGCSVYDKMYFCSGDISYDLIGQSNVLLFNKSVATQVETMLSEQYQAADLYTLVEEDRWTLDTMIALSKSISVDANGVKDKDDTIGYVSVFVAPDGFWAASGLRNLENGADGSVIISDDMDSQKAGDLCDKIVAFLKSSGGQADSTCGAAADGTGAGVFWKNNQALFFNNTLVTMLQEYPFDVGVLPMPKYDEEQAEYLTNTGFGYAIWGIARSATGYEDLCAVLECLASESYRKTIPTYFDTMLLGRQDTADDYAMLELIRDSIVIDGGRVLDSFFEEMSWGMYRQTLMFGRDYLAFYADKGTKLTEQAASLNSLVLNMEKLYG